MSDEVTISNLAVAFLGDEATITGITPPEGSAQAEHCAQFFPVARRALIEMFPWDFATQSVELELKTETVRGWRYAYARPAGCLKVFSVLPPGAIDDYSYAGINQGTYQAADGTIYSPHASGYNRYTPQPFKTETSYATKTPLILTNQQDAQAICGFDIEDTSMFTPLFTLSLAKLLASFVAGPIYKGKTGVDMSARMLQHFELFFSRATMSNAGQEYGEVQQSTPWLAGR